MPRSYFDTNDGDEQQRDDTGLDMADRQAARLAAIDALPDIARDVLPDGDRREMAIRVRTRPAA